MVSIISPGGPDGACAVWARAPDARARSKAGKDASKAQIERRVVMGVSVWRNRQGKRSASSAFPIASALDGRPGDSNLSDGPAADGDVMNVTRASVRWLLPGIGIAALGLSGPAGAAPAQAP